MSICAVEDEEYSIISVYDIDVGDVIVKKINVINIE